MSLFYSVSIDVAYFDSLHKRLTAKRVVVKRPDYAKDLDGVKPSMVLAQKKNRFDVYVKAAMK
jgi:hypothetical protein